MFLRATRAQTAFLLRQKAALFTFYVLLAMAAFTFVGNVLSYQGNDVLSMIQPMKILSLSYNRVYSNADQTILLVQLYPLLVVCPAGFSLAREYQTREDVLISARLGKTAYQLSRLLAAFLTTAIVFCVPFLLEILWNCVSFPLAAAGDPAGTSVYDPAYVQGARNYLFHGLYLLSPYLYAVVGTLFFGVVSGLLGAFTVAVSALIRIKFRALLFLPVFLLLYGTLYLSQRVAGIEWHTYLLLFQDEPKHTGGFFAALLLLAAFSAAAAWWSGRKDSLS